jgi:hypothetical protein
MTADGTPRTPQVGDTITTALHLRAFAGTLPEGGWALIELDCGCPAVMVRGEDAPRGPAVEVRPVDLSREDDPCDHDSHGWLSSRGVEYPVTVLFRPDTPGGDLGPTLHLAMSALTRTLDDVVSILGEDAKACEIDGEVDPDLMWETLAAGYVPLAQRTARPDAPQPVTGGDVERAEVLRQAYNDLTGDGWGPERVDDVLGRVWDAALAAAHAGEAEGDADRLSQQHADALAVLEVVRDHMDDFAYDELHSVLEDGVLLRDEDGLPKHQGRAQRGGEAADREALALSLWDEGLVRPEHLAQAVVAHILDHPLLAARGDAAPTVSAEQVERARLSEPLTYPPGQQVSRAAARHLLAALGIEVRD